jgi:hypothetical protein
VCSELWVAEPGKVGIFREPFEEYRRRQLKLTKKGMLPPQMRPQAAKDVSDPDAAAAAKPAPKKPMKIEIVPAGRKK